MGDNFLAKKSLGEGQPLWLYPVSTQFIGDFSLGGG